LRKYSQQSLETLAKLRNMFFSHYNVNGKKMRSWTNMY